MGHADRIDNGHERSGVKPNRLLVIDDEPNICEVVRTIAADAGYEVCTTTSAAEFKRLLQTLRPTAIVLDVIMPETDGIELMRFLAERDYRRPVLVMSGHRTYLGLSEALGRALGIPSVTAIPKPLDLDRLRGFLAEHAA